MDEFYAGGMYICSEQPVEDYLPGLIDNLVVEVEQQVQVYYPEVTDLRDMLSDNGVQVSLIDNVMAKDCEPLHDGIFRCDKALSGINSGGNTIVVYYRACGSLITLGHEILHSIEEHYLSGMSHGHSTPNFFYESGTSSIEKEISMTVGSWCYGKDGAAL